MRVFRFAAPLTVVAVLALAPVWLLALVTRTPVVAPEAMALDLHAGLLVGLALAGQLALVGGVAAMADATSQRDALRRGVGGLLRSIVPCALALVAAAIAMLALVVPGVLVFGLFALTGAAALEPGPSGAALTRAAAAARGQLGVVAALAIGAVVVDVAIAAVAHRVVLGPDAKHELSAAVVYLRVVALGLVAVSPPIAAALAARYARNRAR